MFVQSSWKPNGHSPCLVERWKGGKELNSFSIAAMSNVPVLIQQRGCCCTCLDFFFPLNFVFPLRNFLLSFLQHCCGPVQMIVREKRNCVPFVVSLVSGDWITVKRPDWMTITLLSVVNFSAVSVWFSFCSASFIMAHCIHALIPPPEEYFFFQVIKSCWFCSEAKQETYPVLDCSDGRKI